MVTVVSREQLPPGGLFQGEDHGGAPISFFWVDAPPGRGPRLHRHPYVETFVVQEGAATFTVGDRTYDVAGPKIVVAPAGVAHKIVNSGDGPLRLVNIHPVPKVITEWLEEEEGARS